MNYDSATLRALLQTFLTANLSLSVSSCWVSSPARIKVHRPIGLYFGFSTGRTNLIGQANRHLSGHFKLTLSQHSTLMTSLNMPFSDWLVRALDVATLFPGSFLYLEERVP